MSRRHYRVAQKEVEGALPDGIFLHNECVIKGICIIAGLVVLLFVKGLILGYLFCKKCKKNI